MNQVWSGGMSVVRRWVTLYSGVLMFLGCVRAQDTVHVACTTHFACEQEAVAACGGEFVIARATPEASEGTSLKMRAFQRRTRP